MKRVLLLIGFVVSSLTVFAQGTVLTTYANNNGSSAVAFEIESSASISIGSFQCAYNAGTTSGDVWTRQGGTATAPLDASGDLAVNTANGWVLHQAGAVVTNANATSAGTITLTTPIIINANGIIGVVLTGSMGYSGSGTTPLTPATFTNSTVTLRAGGTVGGLLYGHGGAMPKLDFQPRGLVGGVNYTLNGPCINPPTPGTANASATTVCVGGTTTLSLSGNTSGMGQTVQWQSSSDNISFINITGATASTYVATVSANTYYRAVVTCTASANSASVLVNTIGSGLSGTYTINKNAPVSATNFQNFTDLSTALVCGSLSGNVTVNVVAGSGSYNEQFKLGSITGAGPNARLTINGNNDTLKFTSTVSGDRAVILMDGTDYVTINNLNIKSGGTVAGFGVNMLNGATNNVINNCRVLIPTDVTSTFFAGIVINGSQTSATIAGAGNNFNRIENSTVTGGYYGISIASSTLTPSAGNVMLNNTVNDFHFYGIYTIGQDSMLIRKTDINRSLRTNITTGYGIFTSGRSRKTEISENWIHDMFKQGSSTTSIFYGIYQTNSDNLGGDEANVFNNLIAQNYNNGTHYLIYNAGSDGWNYYHNTLIEDDATNGGTGITRMFYQLTLADRIQFRNNLVSLNRGGTGQQHLLYLGTATSTVTFNNNAYYAPQIGTAANVNFGYLTSNRNTFADWKTAISGDANSEIGNPLFDAGTNYKPTAAYFNNIGLNLNSIVATDFGGNIRGAFPDPGVWEFTPPPGPDMTVNTLYGIGGFSCGGTTSVGVVLQNIGTDTVTSLTLNWSINGVAQTPIPVTTVFSTGRSDTITLSSIPLTAGANTLVSASITGIGPGVDVDPANNSGSTTLRPGYSGNLYVNQAGPVNDSTFTTFSALGTALMNNGMCGPVNVLVAAGQSPFNEQFKLGQVPGSSAANTLTINGNGNTINFTSTNSGERGVIIMDGTDFTTIDSLTINAAINSTSFSEYGFGIAMFNSANNNIITRNTINVTQGSTSSNFVGISLSGGGSSATFFGVSGNNNRFIGNRINGGYYGLSMYSGSTDVAKGNYAERNILQDQYLYSIYVFSQDSVTVTRNSMSRPNRTTISTFGGVFASGASSNSRITRNRIFNSAGAVTASTSAAYGIYVTSWSGTSAKPNLVANNMIYDLNNGGTAYGLYISSSSNTKFLHNTIAMIDAAPAANTFGIVSGVYMIGTSVDLEFRNNLVAVDKAGGSTSYTIYIGTASSAYNFSNNAYFKGPLTANFGYYGSGTIANLGAWKIATTNDANSASGRPYFVSPTTGDYTPQSLSFNNLGANLTATVSLDINGAVRPITPDPGALEFTGAPCTGLSNVVVNTVTSSAATVNWGATTTPLTVEYGPTGFTQGSGTGIIVTVPAPSTNRVLSGLQPNSCYDVYIRLNCTSTIPNAPPVIGPLTFCTPCLSSLSGIYTVGGTAGARNFATLDSAVRTMNSCGISAPVTFNLAAGFTRTSPITIGSIPGASVVNRITINGNASNRNVIAGLGLDGADFVTFNNIAFVVTSGIAVRLFNEANHNTFNNCRIEASRTTTAFGEAAFAASSSPTSATGSGNNTNRLTITNCEINGGYYGVSVYGPSFTQHGRNVNISNNTFRDQYYYGIYTYGMDSVADVGNDMSLGLRNTINYAHYHGYTDGLELRKNKVYNAIYGAYVFNSNFTDTTTNTNIVNNMMDGSTYGMWISNMRNTNIYHNSYLGGRGLYGSGTNRRLDIRNNVFGTSNTTGYAIYFVTPPLASILDYNAYDTTVSSNFAYSGSAFASLAAWKTARPLFNQNSVAGSVGVVSQTDFHLLGVLANNKGVNTLGVLTDIDGDVRPALGAPAVDMGADEYSPVTDDIALTAARFDRKSNCLTTNDTLVVTIANTIGAAKNFAANTLTIGYNVAGPINSTGTFIVNTGTVALNGTLNVRVSGINMSAVGTYNLTAFIAPNSVNLTAINDTLKNTASAIVNGIFDAQPDTVVLVTNNTTTVDIETKSILFGGGGFHFTEIMHFKTTTGAPAGGWPAWHTSDEHVEITGIPGSSLAGYTFEQWNTTGAAPIGTITFPSGTVVGPNGTAIFSMRAATASPSNFFYDGSGGNTLDWQSASGQGVILKDPSGSIIDAVGYPSNGLAYVFDASAGVSTSMWSGGTPGTGSGTCGIRLQGPDVNSATGWLISSATATQDPNIVNLNVVVPAPANITGFDWILNGTSISTTPKTVVGPFTTSGRYQYIATYASVCGTLRDTVTVLVNLGCAVPSAFTSTVTSCNDVTLNWIGAGDSSIVTVVPSGTPRMGGSLVINDSTFNFTTGMASTTYDVYITNICKGDTLLPTGPFALTIGTQGAPTAAFTVAQAVGLTVTVNAATSTGAGITYAWDFGDGTTGTGVNPSHTYAAGGNYVITLTITNACGTATVTNAVNGIGLAENALGRSLSIYPNPTSTSVSVSFSVLGSEASVRLLELSGKEVMRVSKSAAGDVMNMELNLEKLAGGVYMLEVTSGSMTTMRKVIKK